MSKKNKKILELQMEIQEQQMALDAVMRRVLIVEQLHGFCVMSI